MAGSDLLPFEAMWPTVAAVVVPLETETVDLRDAARRVLRCDATAAWDLPRASDSAMDGYAVRSADTAPEHTLRVLDRDAYAGSDSGARVEPGTAVRIGTGGIVPPGADAIAPKEIVRRAGDRITVNAPLPAGAHVRRQGEELRVGATVVAAGERLGPLRIAAAGAAGRDDLALIEKGVRNFYRLIQQSARVAAQIEDDTRHRIAQLFVEVLHFALEVVRNVEGHLTVQGSARGLEGAGVDTEQLAVVVEHLLVVRDRPGRLGRVAMESTGQVIVDTAKGHLVQGMGEYLERPWIRAGLVRGQQHLELGRIRKFGSRRESAVLGFIGLSDLIRGANQ